jgi:hypothetical protein
VRDAKSAIISTRVHWIAQNERRSKGMMRKKLIRIYSQNGTKSETHRR